jgi:hypothetical protein
MALRFIAKAKARVKSSKKKAASSNEPPPPASFSTLPEKDVKDYGYGRSASPSVTLPEKDVKDYGYGRASPSPSLTSEDSSSKYGYGDGNGNPASEAEDVSKYGYGDDASPEVAAQYGYGDADAAPSDCGASRPSTRTPRRSSMKQGNNTSGRRASIGYTGEVEMKLPGRKDPVRRRTSIAFSQEDEVKEVERVSTLTDDPKALWFQKDELHNIKTKLRTIIGSVERGDENAGKLCTRGLECHIGQSSKTKINAAWDAVVIEQYMQHTKGNFDDETISKKYKIFARGSQEKAAERAKEDEAAIARYQNDTRRRMRRMSM